MRGELLYVHHPNRVRIKWGIFWLVIIISFFTGIYAAADHIRTHTLPVGQLQLTVPYTKYVQGEEVTFSLTNSFNTTIFVTNECPAEPLMVYRQEGGKWVRIHDKATSADCPSEARTIPVPSSGVVTGSFAKWKNLFAKPGKYRIVAYVEYYNALPYADIEILEKPVAGQPGAAAVSVASSSPILSAKSSSSGSSTVPSWNSTTTPAAPGSTVTPTPPASNPSPSPSPSPSPNPAPAKKTVTITVTSSGVYASTNISLNIGDTLTISYPSGSKEVITRFIKQGSTSASISSITVDSENRTGSRTMASAGTWNFNAAPDITTGNTGVLTVQ